jgi:hypothetical protein
LGNNICRDPFRVSRISPPRDRVVDAPKVGLAAAITG